MPQKVLRRREQSAGVGLRAVLAAQAEGASTTPIPSPPNDVSHKRPLPPLSRFQIICNDAISMLYLSAPYLLPTSLTYKATNMYNCYRHPHTRRRKKTEKK